MTRDELLFQIGYSIRLEKMQSMFLARVDRALNFLQLFLGAAIVTTKWPIVTGIAVSVLAAISFVYQLGSKATEAKLQKQRFEKLLARAPSLTDEVLHTQFSDMQETDSQVIGSLMNPAYFGECVRLGRTPDVALTFLEKICAFVAGDLPHV